MSEPIHEQIAQWIQSALDGAQDPDLTLTLRAVRPRNLDWSVTDQNFKHNDVIIAAIDFDTQNKTASISRGELAKFKCYGIIRTLPANTAADTVVSRMIETIRRKLMAGNSGGRACNDLAYHIDCPKGIFGVMDGGLVAEVDVQVTYRTGLLDGYEQK